MLDAKMTAPHIKLCIVFGSNVRRKNGRLHIFKLCIVFGSNVRRKNDGLHILNYVSSSALMLDDAIMIGLRKNDILNYVSSSVLMLSRKNDGSTY